MIRAFLADVALARRQLRVLETIRAERDPRRHRVETWGKLVFGWVLPVVLAPLPGWYGMIVPAVYLLGFVSVWPPLRLNTFEALRAPSRRALYAARLTRSLPWLAWLGISAAASFAWSAPWAERLCFSLAGLGLVVLFPLFFPGLSFSSGLLLRRTPMLICWVLTFAGLVFYPTGVRWWNDPALTLDGPVLLVFPVAIGVVAVGLLALQVWLLGWMEPVRQMGLMITSNVPVASPGAIQGSLKPGHVGPQHLLSLVRAGSTVITRLWIARLIGYFGRVPLRTHLFRAGWVLLCAPALVFVALEQLPGLGYFTWVPVWFSMLLDLNAAVGDLPRRPRLYLLGVDYRPQLLSRLSTFWASPLTLFVTVLMIGVALFSPVWDFPLAIGAACLGMAAFREGWWSWPAPWYWPRPLPAALTAVLAPVGLVLLALWVTWGDQLGLPVLGLSAAGRLFLFAGVAGGLGAGGILTKLLCFDEHTLRRVSGEAAAPTVASVR